jgi:hypothetical protein
LPLPAVQAETIHVPGDQPTIQKAIDAAADGDTVLVSPGTYYEYVHFKGKAIDLTSSHGAAATVIDGMDHYIAVHFRDDEGPDSKIEGFTITNAHGSLIDGGGIYCDGASPTIRNNIVTDNSCYIGGGILCYFGSPIIDGNVITHNSTIDQGGGISCFYSSANITNNFIAENSADVGGGIGCWDDSSTITGNIISKNTAYWGGGILLRETITAVSNNVLFANTSWHKGGGLYCHEAIVVITNNTFFKNEATYGGGICCVGTWALVANTILWDNQAPTGKEILLGDDYGPSSLFIHHSNIEGGQASIDILEGGGAYHWGLGMLVSDPLFVGSSEHDVHLTFNSPCRGSGDNNATGIPDLDFEGDPRIFQGTVDIGADEFHAHLYLAGDYYPGGSITGILAGLPGTWPVGLLLGSGLLDPPVFTPWGTFHLAPPWFILTLPPIPADGVLVIPATIPSSPAAPYDLPMQALIGLGPEALTNLEVLQVR